MTDPNGHTPTTAYDALTRPIALTDANGDTTTSEYDAVGDVLATTDPTGNTTSFDYDALNRQTRVTDSLGNDTHFGYDAVGNRTAMTDANGVVTRYEYDQLNRLTAVVENLDAGGPADHQTNVRTEHSYDANGNRRTINDGNGHVTTFVYDALNRLRSEADALGNMTTYASDAAGNRTALTDANGLTTGFASDRANRLVRINYPAPDADVLFEYDAAGNRTLMSDGTGDTTWTYDELNRVASVEAATGPVGYGYDAAGNRTSLGYPDGKQVSYAYDPANRMTSVTDWGGQETGYAYDGSGRTTSVSLPNGVVSNYAYDDAGRLLSIFHQAGAEVLSSFEYTYDSVGNRVRVIENMVLPETPTPTPTETPTPEATPTVAPRLADFVLLGKEGAWVEQNGQVLSGDVGANVASAGPYLADEAEVAIGIGADVLDPASRVLGDSVYLRDNASVYDVYYNELTGLGTVLGQEHTPLDLPLVSAFPDVPAFSPGTQNFDIPQNGSLSLDAGAYGLLK